MFTMSELSPKTFSSGRQIGCSEIGAKPSAIVRDYFLRITAAKYIDATLSID
jgi:hypothetical protein